MAKSNTNKEPCWSDKLKWPPRRGWKMDKRRERSDGFLQETTHLEHAKKEKKEMYCLLLCHIHLGTVHTSYSWISNSYSSNSIQERKGSHSGIIIIHMVPIEQYSTHCLQHTRVSLIIDQHTNSIILFCCTYPTQSYVTINNNRTKRMAKSVIICFTVLIVLPYSI